MILIIMGIDPGYAITGYGVIKFDGNYFKMLEYGVIETKSNLELHIRLKALYDELIEIIDRYKPTHVAVEELFFNKNVKTAINVAHGRGIALLAASNRNIEIFEYTPLQVKQALSGSGRAEKCQMQNMVKILLNLNKIPKPDDAADALAVAICHANTVKFNKIINSQLQV